MRTIPMLVAVALALTLLPSSDVTACGDKFLVVGRGVRYQHIQSAPHPASVLVYMNAGSKVESAVKDMQLQTALTLAGHAETVVQSHAELQKALDTGKYDVVLADLSEAPSIQKIISSASSKPALLPVVYESSKDELAVVRSQYSCYLKAPARSGYFLAAIDEAMASQPRTRIAQKNK